MKYVIIQGDGMGDFLQKRSPAPTPLEAARTPHFDRVAGAGRFGLIRTIPDGLPPGSDVGNLALFGYDPQQYYTGRSPLEAAAMGVALGPDDIAFRMNLVSLRGEGKAREMLDFAGGHIGSENAAKLVAVLNENLADGTFQFYPGVSYRHLLVWRGGLEQMHTTPPHDITGQVIAPHLPSGEGAEALQRIMDASAELFRGHAVNAQQEAEGHSTVDAVWLWGQGKAPQMPTFEKMHGLRGACLSPVDLVRGVAVYAGFANLEVPGMTDFIDTDYAAQGRAALEALRTYDLVYVHIEAPDEAGHMGKVDEKIKAIEQIDARIVGPLIEGLPALGEHVLFISSDHATPPSIMTHSPDPVPFAMASGTELAGSSRTIKYGEAEALKSADRIESGYTVMEQILRHGG